MLAQEEYALLAQQEDTILVREEDLTIVQQENIPLVQEEDPRFCGMVPRLSAAALLRNPRSASFAE